MRLLVSCLTLTLVASAADVAGLPNFHKVNDHVYRGGQPSEAGLRHLAETGIKTIVDLREPGERNDWEKKFAETAGMRFVSVPMPGLHAPKVEDVVKVLALLSDDSAAPVFVHCRRGADRTGTVIACYRISHDGWDNRKALQEAKSFGMSRLERAMQNYVLHFEPAQIRAAAAQ